MESPEKNQILYYVLYVVFKRKVLLTLLCLVSFVLIIFFTFLRTPEYQASAKILIRPHPQQQLILFRDLATPGKEAVRVNPAANLIHILTSQEMARRVVERFKLGEKLHKREKSQEFRVVIKDALSKVLTYPLMLLRRLRGAEKQSPNYVSKAMDELLTEAEDIQLEADTNIINLAIWEDNPELASDIANYMATLLIEKSTELEQSNATLAYDFTSRQLGGA